MITPEKQVVSLHTFQGVQLYQFLGNSLIDLTWSRESDTVSRCELTVPSTLGIDDNLPDIVPWLHWVSVWDDTGQDLYWTGPVQKAQFSRQAMQLSARDVSTLTARTRCPMTKRWDIAWPADIASELYGRMVELHGLDIDPIVMPVHPLQYDERYSYQAKADDVMMDSMIDELVRLGLKWTVVSGVPILGRMSRQPIASLSENDFVGEGMTVVRDGQNFANDVLLRGGDSLSRSRIPTANLNMQSIVNIDNMFGVSNVDRAVKQHVKYTSRFHDAISIPDNAVLHPEAPLSIDQLIPTTRLVLDAYGLVFQAELTGIDVSCSSDSSTVSIRVTGVDDEPTELSVVTQRGSISGVKGDMGR